MTKFQPKWRSRAAWESTLALVILIVKKAYPELEFDLEWANLVADAILVAAGAWGVWNNPNDSKNY